MVLANILYDTDENYNLASTFSRWNEVDLPLIAQQRLLVVVGVAPRVLHHKLSAIIPNNARGRVRALLRIAFERKQLRRCG